MFETLWQNIRKAVWDDNRKELAEKNKPPAAAIPILKPDGRPYMWLWYEDSNQRVCMMFANVPGYTVRWTSLSIPDMINALVQLVADGAVVKPPAVEEPEQEPEPVDDVQ